MRRHSGWLLLMAVLCMIMTLVLSVLVNARMTASNERRACGTLLALIEAYEETPPSTPAGRKIEKAYHDQYALYGCQPPAAPVVTPSTYGYPPK